MKRKKKLEIEAFLKEVVEVSKRHKLSLSHEDAHGSFIVIDYFEPNTAWLMMAYDGTKPNE